MKRYKRVLFFIQPKKRKNYMAEKYEILQKRDFKFLCINSLDLATLEEQRMVMEWIYNRLNIKPL